MKRKSDDKSVVTRDRDQPRDPEQGKVAVAQRGQHQTLRRSSQHPPPAVPNEDTSCPAAGYRPSAISLECEVVNRNSSARRQGGQKMWSQLAPDSPHLCHLCHLCHLMPPSLSLAPIPAARSCRLALT